MPTDVHDEQPPEEVVSLDDLEAGQGWPKPRIEFAVRAFGSGGVLGGLPSPTISRARRDEVLKYLDDGDKMREELTFLWNSHES